MGLRDFYYSMEERYYKVLDALDAKGIPVYKVIDPVDKVMPSFILFLIILGLIVAGVVYAIAIAAGISPSTHDIVVTFIDKSGNAISDLSLTATFGDTTDQITTNALGAVLMSVPSGKQIRFTGTFRSNTINQTVDVNSASSYTVKLPFNSKYDKVSFTLEPADGSLLGQVNVLFSCSNTGVAGPQDIYANTNPIIEVEVNPDCGNLLVTVAGDGYAGFSGAVMNNDVVKLDSENLGGNSNLIVKVVDAFNVPIANSRVDLFYGELNVFLTSQDNLSSGIATFSGLAVGLYKITGSKLGYLSADQVVTISTDGETNTATVVLASAGAGSGTLALNILDFDTQTFTDAIVGTKVCLFTQNAAGQQDQTVSCSEVTQENKGEIRITVSDASKKYIALISKAGYKTITEKDLSANTSPVPVYMKLLGKNDKCIKVKVADAQDKPISNALVYLYDANENLVSIDPIVSDENGLAVDLHNGAFCQSEKDTFKAYAYKTVFSGFSDAFEFDPNTPSENYDALVKLNIPYATLHLIIRDMYGNVIPNALIKLYDAYAAEINPEGAKHTGSNGEFVLDGIRADKKLYYIIDKEGYETYVSIANFLTPDMENTYTVVLDKPTLDRTPKIVVDGIYTTDGKVVSKVGPGELYKVRYKITLPSQTDDSDEKYTLLNATFIAGTEDIVEKEMFFYERVDRSALTHIVKGQKYVQDNEESTISEQSTRSTTDESKQGLAFEDEVKWVHLRWNLEDLDIKHGVFFVDTYFRTRNIMPENTKLTFSYSITAKHESPAVGEEDLFYPLDEEGLQDTGDADETLRGLDSIFNNKMQHFVFSGKGQRVCDDMFCVESTIFDYKNEIISDVTPDTPYIANIEQNYLFSFALINNNKKPLTNYRVMIENPEEALLFLNYNINSVSNISSEGESNVLPQLPENSYEIIYRDTNTLQQNGAIRGDINFKPTKIGNSTIKFTVIEDNSIIYTKEFYVGVNANKDMNVTITPTLIPSYTYIDWTIQAKDAETGEGLRNVKVYVKDVSNTIIANDVTGDDGILVLKIPSQKPNMTLKLRMYKEEYRPYDAEYKTTSDFAIADPEEIKVTVKVNEYTGTGNFKLTNISDMPVKVSSISLAGNFDEYIDVSAANSYLTSAFLNKVLDAKHDLQMPIKLTVTPLGETIAQNIEYDAKLSITLSRINADGFWKIDVPVKVYITLGDSLDNVDCLGVDFKEGKLVSTDSKQVTDAITFTNGCTVKGQPIRLQNLEAKVKWSGNTLGTIVLGRDEKDLPLQPSYYRTLAVELSPDLEETYVVTLSTKSGNIVGSGKVEVWTRASYNTSSGLQFVENKITYDVEVLKLHDCFTYELPEGEADLIITYRNKDTQFKVKNVCQSDTEVRFDWQPDLIEITPKTFSLKGAQEQTVKVKLQDSPVGVYLLEMRAKTPGHTLEAVRAGIEGFRIFIKPLETDCIVMDNYEFDIFGTSAWTTAGAEDVNINNYKFGYIINRCYEIPITQSYPLEIKTGGLDDWKAIVGGILTPTVGGIAGAASSFAFTDDSEEKKT